MPKFERVWHPWTAWECYRAGFYESAAPDGMDAAMAREAYRAFLADIQRFDAAISRVFLEWPNSCEHFLTNSDINRIAWLGQASMCIATGVPSCFRAGFAKLTPEQQAAANAKAAERLAEWESNHARKNSGVRTNVGGPRVRRWDSRRGSVAAHAQGTGPELQGYLFCDYAERRGA